MQAPFELESTADGDLSGRDPWVLEPLDDGVRITSRWHVHLLRPWMRAAAPLPQPVFAWNA